MHLMSDQPRPHPWALIRWAVVGSFVIAWIPSAVDPGLAWIWIGYAGLVFVCFGMALAVAPSWFLERREWFIDGTPRWARRIAARLDRSPAPTRGAVRIGGIAASLLGIADLAVAALVLGRG